MLPSKIRTSNINPLINIDQLFTELSKRFDDAMHSFGISSVDGISRPDFLPPMDVLESKEAYLLTLECPGMEKDQLKVSFSESTLVIVGERKEEPVNEGTKYHIQERSFGSFRREVRLPEEVESDKIDVTYRNGVLKVAIPKNFKAKLASKQIEIKD